MEPKEVVESVTPLLRILEVQDYQLALENGYSENGLWFFSVHIGKC
jgi:hypothetical protein